MCRSPAPPRSPRRWRAARPSGRGRTRRRPWHRRPARRRGRRRLAGWRHCAASRGAATSAGSWRGATSVRLSVASSSVAARSSARPLAIRASRFAVAGATTTRSAARDSSMVAHLGLVGQREEGLVHLLAREAREGQRRHELLRRRRHHRPYPRTALAQPPQEIERLVGRDPAADDEEDGLVGEGHEGDPEVSGFNILLRVDVEMPGRRRQPPRHQSDKEPRSRCGQI